MLDPFPLSPPTALQKAIKPLADYFSLTTLPLHAHEVLVAFALYHLVNTRLSPFLSSRMFPDVYPKFNKRTKINWDVHVVSFVQSTLINALALWVMWSDEERADMNWKGRVWGYTGAGGLVQAFACGYFLWDLWVSAVHVDVFGWGLLAHAVSALMVFSLGFRPFVNFYGPTFILYELSSPFLNIHWFCDKLSLTGSKLQLYNGMLLLLTFLSCRLIWGTYNSFRVFSDIWRAHAAGAIHAGPGPLGAAASDGGHVSKGGMANVSGEPVSEIMRFAGGRDVPVWLSVSYLGANLVLNALNFFWYGKMIETVRKRFEPPFGTKRVEKEEWPAEKDILVGRGVYADGTKSVEVSAREVRSRRKGSQI